MPIPIGPITAVPGVVSNTPLVNLGAIQALKISNGSPFDLTISGFGIIGQEIVPAGTEYRLYDNGQNLGALNILPVNNSGISGTGIVNLVAYLVGEKLPEGIWPLTIPTQIVQAKVANVPAVVNDGNPVGTQFLESTVSGAPGSTWSFTNDGNSSFIGVLISNVVHKLIQFANSGNELKLGDALSVTQITEILGILLIDNYTSISGKHTVITGTTSGTIDIYEFISGTNFKYIMLIWSATYNSTLQTYALTNVFTKRCSLRGYGNTGPIRHLASGVAKNFDLVTGYSVGGAKTTTSVATPPAGSGWDGSQGNPWDTIEFSATGNVGACLMIFEGQ